MKMSLAGDRGDKENSTFPAVHITFLIQGGKGAGQGSRKIQNQIWFRLIKHVIHK